MRGVDGTESAFHKESCVFGGKTGSYESANVARRQADAANKRREFNGAP